MGTGTLTYDPRTDRYCGVQSDGTPVQVDGDGFAEAFTRRRRDGMSYDQALDETLDPDGWSEEMAGWIPAGE